MASLTSPFSGLSYSESLSGSLSFHLKEVVSQEETSDRLLDSFYHIKEISQNKFDRGLFRGDVSGADCDQKVKPWDYVASVLDGLVKVAHFSAFSLLLDEVVFKESKLIESHHIKLEVVPWGEKRSLKFTQHG